MKIMVKDQLLTYRDSGEGKVVLMLHGWGTNLNTFDNIATVLEQKYRVLRIDFPGFGGSPIPASDWSVDDYVLLVHDFLEKKGVKALYAVVGHSFGGRVVLKGVGNGSLCPERVVLIGSAGIKPRVTSGSIAYRTVAKTGKAVLSIPGLRKFSSRARNSLYNHAGSTDYLNAGGLQKIFQNVINEDLLPYAPLLRQPTLLLWGENDDSTPLSDAKKFEEIIPAASLIVLPNAGHFVYIDKPNESLEHIKRFLA